MPFRFQYIFNCILTSKISSCCINCHWRWKSDLLIYLLIYLRCICFTFLTSLCTSVSLLEFTEISKGSVHTVCFTVGRTNTWPAPSWLHKGLVFTTVCPDTHFVTVTTCKSMLYRCLPIFVSVFGLWFACVWIFLKSKFKFSKSWKCCFVEYANRKLTQTSDVVFCRLPLSLHRPPPAELPLNWSANAHVHTVHLRWAGAGDATVNLG